MTKQTKSKKESEMKIYEEYHKLQSLMTIVKPIDKSKIYSPGSEPIKQTAEP